MNQTTSANTKRPTGFYVSSVVLVVVAIVAIALLSHSKTAAVENEVAARTRAVDAGPFVRTTAVSFSPAADNLKLEGDALPIVSTVLYAKIGGYLREINVDKGDHVQKGQVLAVIESPETDRQYLALKAEAENKAKIAEANRELLKKGLIPILTAQQSDADAEVAKENLNAIEIQKGYEVIRAPFSGTITSRHADPGALIQNAINQETTTLPIVTVAQVDRLRIDVYLDQRYASFVHLGDSVEVSVPERPGFVVTATVTRFSDELDPQTRMRLVEIEVPNRNGDIVAWSTVNVTLKVNVPVHMEVPTAALVVRGEKYFLAVVGSDNAVHFREVHIGSNDGRIVQILDGVESGDRVALNLKSSVVEGSHVQIVSSNAPKPL